MAHDPCRLRRTGTAGGHAGRHPLPLCMGVNPGTVREQNIAVVLAVPRLRRMGQADPVHPAVLQCAAGDGRRRILGILSCGEGHGQFPDRPDPLDDPLLHCQYRTGLLRRGADAGRRVRLHGDFTQLHVRCAALLQYLQLHPLFRGLFRIPEFALLRDIDFRKRSGAGTDPTAVHGVRHHFRTDCKDETSRCPSEQAPPLCGQADAQTRPEIQRRQSHCSGGEEAAASPGRCAASGRISGGNMEDRAPRTGV